MAPSPAYRAPAVVRAFDLLKAVARARQPVGISRLARDLSLGKSTVHGLVNALVAAGALQRAAGTRKLHIGPLVHELATRAVNWPRVTARLQPRLEDLCRQLQQTVCLGLLGSCDHLILAAAEPENTLKISASPGTRLPLLAGALGKLLLAGLPEQKARRILADRGLPRFTNAGPSSVEQYLAELEQVRQKGYAIDRQEYLPGVRAVAVNLSPCPVPGLALWCVGLADAFGKTDPDRLGKTLVFRQKELAAALEVNKEAP